jgi:hypothetical protein
MNFKEQEKLFDIEWFEGPMLSLFSNGKGELFIYKWVDVNQDSHTWLVFRTTHDLVAAYAQKVISEQALILLAPDKSWHLVNINPELKFSNKRTLTTENLTQTFLPKSPVFFKDENCVDIDKLRSFVERELMTA